jgi:hypothetical protein
VYCINFGALTYEAFEALSRGQHLIPNWPIGAICYHVQQMVTGEARKQLNLNRPPRTLKSFIVSVALRLVVGPHPQHPDYLSPLLR